MKQRTAIKLIIDNNVLNRYFDHYLLIHPRARKNPIKRPIHESINEWMIMRRMEMNALKQRWKEFIEWLVAEQGYADLHIEKCEITQTVYFQNNRRHDIDNTVPKFILDGLVESGMIVDDDWKHVVSLTMKCRYDKENPRTELEITKCE